LTSLPWDSILGIAHEDARHRYRDLSAYTISVRLEEDGWHVDYDLKDPLLKGGGPHYVIDPKGRILSRRCEQ